MGETEVGSELGSVETGASVAVQATVFKKVKLVTAVIISIKMTNNFSVWPK